MDINSPEHIWAWLQRHVESNKIAGEPRFKPPIQEWVAKNIEQTIQWWNHPDFISSAQHHLPIHYKYFGVLKFYKVLHEALYFERIRLLDYAITFIFKDIKSVQNKNASTQQIQKLIIDLETLNNEKRSIDSKFDIPVKNEAYICTLRIFEGMINCIKCDWSIHKILESAQSEVDDNIFIKLSHEQTQNSIYALNIFFRAAISSKDISYLIFGNSSRFYEENKLAETRSDNARSAALEKAKKMDDLKSETEKIWRKIFKDRANSGKKPNDAEEARLVWKRLQHCEEFSKIATKDKDPIEVTTIQKNWIPKWKGKNLKKKELCLAAGRQVLKIS